MKDCITVAGSLSGVENNDQGFVQSSVGPYVASKPKGRSTAAVAKGARFTSSWGRGGSVSADQLQTPV